MLDRPHVVPDPIGGHGDPARKLFLPEGWLRRGPLDSAAVGDCRSGRFFIAEAVGPLVTRLHAVSVPDSDGGPVSSRSDLGGGGVARN